MIGVVNCSFVLNKLQTSFSRDLLTGPPVTTTTTVSTALLWVVTLVIAAVVVLVATSSPFLTSTTRYALRETIDARNVPTLRNFVFILLTLIFKGT